MIRIVDVFTGPLESFGQDATADLSGKAVRRIAFDLKLMRPAGAELQARLGGDPMVAHYFPKSTWLREATEDIEVYVVNGVRIGELVERVNRRARNP